MNALQTFMAAANVQARPTIQEAFTIAGDATVYYGTFGDPQMVPVMTRQGYQDHEVMVLKAEVAQFVTQPVSRVTITRTQTGEQLFVHMVNVKEVVVYTFMLTDREI